MDLFVTVVLRSYNRLGELRALVQNVLGQDHPHFEVLIVDSTPNVTEEDIRRAIGVTDDLVCGYATGKAEHEASPFVRGEGCRVERRRQRLVGGAACDTHLGVEGSDTLLPLSDDVRVAGACRVEALGFVGGRAMTGDGQVAQVRVDAVLEGSDIVDVLDAQVAGDVGRAVHVNLLSKV